MSKQTLHVVLGITGGIAAYKSLSLIRLLSQRGAEVKVVATPNALQFVTELSLQTLSQNKVYTDPFKKLEHFDIEHISLAEWADVLIVAPATANILAKFANGIADDALSTLFLATTAPIFLAPAMNKNMLSHPATQNNLQTLRTRGCHILESNYGHLACGTDGAGRMQEPEQITETVFHYFDSGKKLAGKKALVTAGPTYEPIDPVRFIGNHSSGLMGFSIAEELSRQGAEVFLVAGPTSLTVQNIGINRTNVQTGQQMFEVCKKLAAQVDIVVMAAAVADYTPEVVATEKIKKSDAKIQLSLKKNMDILTYLGNNRPNEEQCVVGFALETENELENAKQKLKNKNADIIVLNSLKNHGAGFQCKTNLVTLIDKRGNITEGELKSKQEVARDIVSYIIDYQIKK